VGTIHALICSSWRVDRASTLEFLMDESQFDNLTKIVGSRLSRRVGLGLLAGAALLGHDDPALVAAKGKRGKKGGKGKGGKGKGKKKKIAICDQGQTKQVNKRGWTANFPGATAGECCATCPDMCFATDNPQGIGPSGFDCCPADKFCAGARGLPDQCCYSNYLVPDGSGAVINEVCARDVGGDLDAQGTLCCRPCNNETQAPGCCGPGFFCNAADTCQSLGTARLPRQRRP
jgi:hypothetical protein